MIVQIKRIIIFLTIVYIAPRSFGQEIESDYQTRTNVTMSFTPVKKLKFEFSPELRWNEGFEAKLYLLESKAKYKLYDFLSVGAVYRFAINPRDIKSPEYINRFSFSALANKEFNRFDPFFRLRYTNDADDEVSNKAFLRYKFGLKYDIMDCKITPFVAAEAFHELDNNVMHKMRYSTGIDYKLFKGNYLELSYKFDYYMQEYKNKNIVTVGYKIKF